MAEQNEIKTNRLVVRLATAAIAMFGFGFALVPLYDVFCDITGLNGKNFSQGPAEVASVDRSRTVKVQFVTVNPAGMPWDFKPTVRSMRVYPGEDKHDVLREKFDCGMDGCASRSICNAIGSRALSSQGELFLF